MIAEKGKGPDKGDSIKNTINTPRSCNVKR